ncbi:hypothetical protein Leryth_008581 [Lithospermum erythrorhizon]|nr:hypothetical protein Leryth_008581 [Lithospermum erythrorhizon]
MATSSIGSIRISLETFKGRSSESTTPFTKLKYLGNCKPQKQDNLLSNRALSNLRLMERKEKNSSR